MDRMTNRCKNITFQQLRNKEVVIKKWAMLLSTPGEIDWELATPCSTKFRIPLINWYGRDQGHLSEKCSHSPRNTTKPPTSDSPCHHDISTDYKNVNHTRSTSLVSERYFCYCGWKLTAKLAFENANWSVFNRKRPSSVTTWNLATGYHFLTFQFWSPIPGIW